MPEFEHGVSASDISSWLRIFCLRSDHVFSSTVLSNAEKGLGTCLASDRDSGGRKGESGSSISKGVV